MDLLYQNMEVGIGIKMLKLTGKNQEIQISLDNLDQIQKFHISKYE